MESRTRSDLPSHADGKLKREQEETISLPNKISAYYSLVFPHSTFYIQTLSVTIGRRCYPNPNAPTSSSSPTLKPVQVDVDLGALKSVSRLHAKIEYDPEEDRFILVVIGRNGAWVDGVWQGSGTRAPLGERSQIQIASRIFHFVLPPPPPPDDTPSPSSNSSTNRPRSPSLDVTSISPPSSQPSHSPPPREIKPPIPPSEPQLGNSNLIARSTKANTKKRKKSDISDISVPPPPPPKPEVIPPKPTLTYAQLIYRAIKAHDGKATLQEICAWIAKEYDYYRFTDGTAWMSSVRHNLSSGRAFKKMERCGGDRGKGFFWSLDEAHQHTLEEQDSKLQSGSVDNTSKLRKKDKTLEPPLKRSVKGDAKEVVPPPLISTPFSMQTSSDSSVMNTSAASLSALPTTTAQITSAMPAYTQAQRSWMASNPVTSYTGAATNPYSALTQPLTIHEKPNTNVHTSNASHSTAPSVPAIMTFNIPTAPITAVPVTSTSTLVTVPASSSIPSSVTVSSSSASTSTNAPIKTSTPSVPDIAIPITLGPVPPTHPSYSATHPNNSAKEGYMILHERKLVLDPDVFSSLTKEMLVELEKMGASKAIEILTGHLVRVLKERRKNRKNARGRGRGVKGAGGPSQKVATAGSTGDPTSSVPAILSSLSILSSNKQTSSGSVPTVPMVVETSSLAANPNPLIPVPIIQTPLGDTGSPIVIIDSDDDGPAIKKRKVGAPSSPFVEPVVPKYVTSATRTSIPSPAAIQPQA
ncbi:hypothetical protein J3R30DRAFT_3523865 [Lentinula aciculospora]|uniref:Uncharacterized protein n=1 Tax=Lentinula aciculospora TaxID=153920 RepID=A0A9W9A1B0_9AGAR|nr:hypothetical protein J3R30DRAFT_3523865 [Lentinula aciculospora]